MLKDTKAIINYLQNLTLSVMRGKAIKGFKETIENLIKDGKVQPDSKIADLFEQETGKKICREV